MISPTHIAGAAGVAANTLASVGLGAVFTQAVIQTRFALAVVDV